MNSTTPQFENTISVQFASRWEEGQITTSALLDLDTGIVSAIDQSGDGDHYQHLIGQFILIGDKEIAVQLEPDDSYRIDAPALAAIRDEALTEKDCKAECHQFFKGDPLKASLFWSELVNSVESLTTLADQHGARTLVDLMYLQNAILSGGFIDSDPDESSVQQIVMALPSADHWLIYIQVTQPYMMQVSADVPQGGATSKGIGNPLSIAFEVTEIDVANVLRQHAVRVLNANGRSFNSMAEDLIATLNLDAISAAALDVGTSLEDQTTAAHEEIARQLIDRNILKGESPPSLMTDAQYLSVKGTKCPRCRLSEIKGDSVEIDGGTATQDSVCSHCGFEWTDVYGLVGYTTN
ncbi:hypothetical protein [Parachitinimonas caeni]|uniref:Uncharacterized protein n=1 Tax=Parachitinimonas caeni TaxID=3031301 RepID=A0ABT7E300_9NEIS|nr:hypothetical protein [Parachitinimonas caeni]MDK2126697.1 hypothetical protein [Parachitinimonas caeni]